MYGGQSLKLKRIRRMSSLHFFRLLKQNTKSTNDNSENLNTLKYQHSIRQKTPETVKIQVIRLGKLNTYY